SMREVSPTIFCVAATSSWARGPCVTINNPIIPSFLVDVAMRDARGPPSGGQKAGGGHGGRHGAVLAARAADRDGEIALPFLDVSGQQEPEEIVHPREEFVVFGQIAQERKDLRIEPGLALQTLDEERILQETDV